MNLGVYDLALVEVAGKFITEGGNAADLYPVLLGHFWNLLEESFLKELFLKIQVSLNETFAEC